MRFGWAMNLLPYVCSNEEGASSHSRIEHSPFAVSYGETEHQIDHVWRSVMLAPLITLMGANQSFEHLPEPVVTYAADIERRQVIHHPRPSRHAGVRE